LGEAVSMKYDEFTELSPLHRQDLAVNQGAGFLQDGATGKAIGAIECSINLVLTS
jgi:hypothetical protein